MYCSTRCAKLAYEYRRYHEDKDFRVKMHSSSYDTCPICGGKKHKQASMCRSCWLKHRSAKIDISSIVDNMIVQTNDSESILNDKKRLEELLCLDTE